MTAENGTLLFDNVTTITGILLYIDRFTYGYIDGWVRISLLAQLIWLCLIVKYFLGPGKDFLYYLITCFYITI